MKILTIAIDEDNGFHKIATTNLDDVEEIIDILQTTLARLMMNNGGNRE